MKNWRTFGLLLASLGLGAGTLLTPLGANVASADQPPVANTSSVTSTYVTDASWLANNGSGSVAALVECPNPAWTASIPGASWIWYPDTSCIGGSPGDAPIETVTFTKTFTLGTPGTGTLYLAADNSATVTINGTTIVGTTGDPTGLVSQDNFQSVATVDLTGYLVPGANTIVINGTNAPYVCNTTTCNPAGVLASLTVSSSLTSTSSCKNGGWMNWTDANGNPFVNQGDCVSYVVNRGNDPMNG
jgi:hypothetical protein